jgi:alkaline phosphatase D
VNRRDLLRLGLGSVLGAAVGPRSTQARQAPAIITPDSARPGVPCGVASGDVSDGRAVIWSRTDRPARLVVEYTTTGSYADGGRIAGPAALEEWDYTARVVLTDLPPGQLVRYRARFVDLGDLETESVAVEGSFRSPDLDERPVRDVTIAWSADTCGQGWGIDLARGGFGLYEVMRRAQPDVFVHCGDLVYADNPLLPEVKLDDGSVWRNVVTPEKAKVAETLDEYRGQYRYNLLDEHLRRFNAEVPTLAVWDDHEVFNNFYEQRSLEDDARYTERRMGVLIARGRRAFLDYQPMAVEPDDPDRIYRARRYGPLVDLIALDMRSLRGANSSNRQATPGPETALLGAAQLAWAKRRLKTSRSTWKVVVTGMPIGLVVTDYPLIDVYEGIANREDGRPLGRELEIAELLAFIKREGIRNVVFLTGDVHYCSALHYEPTRARFTDFDPFWEFVAGPIHAGTFGPNALDMTFGPEAKFVGIPPGMKPNRPPSDGYQFFGTFRVSARDRAATVTLFNLAGQRLYQVELPPER